MTSSRRSLPTALPLPLHSLADAEQARERLISLSFPDLARAVARMLARAGYRDVRLMGVPHERGRNAHGGLDIRALLPNDLTQAIVIAQVKQYRDPVPRSFVDELRGAMLRLGAQQGLLITTSSFAPAARDAAAAAQHSLPVRLIDGAELAALLALHRVPVGQAGEGSRAGTRRPQPLPPPVTVIVSIGSGRGRSEGGGR